MAKLVVPENSDSIFSPPGEQALFKYMTKHGKAPPVTLQIFFIEDVNGINSGHFSLTDIENVNKGLFIDKFMSYKFSQSILVPVDAFSCEVFYKPDPKVRKPREGDIFVLKANNIPLASGIIDQLDMETEARTGTRLNITGRNLLGQWEDQDSVSIDSKILYGKEYTIQQIVTSLAKDTRINPTNLVQSSAPKRPYLAATQPGESKLSSMQRYCECLDIYFWCTGDGSLTVGRPTMYGAPAGKYYMIESARTSNCLSIRSTRASTQIPNIILPIWNGQESVQALNLPQGVLLNGAEGPARLRNNGHRVPKAVVVSTPQGNSPQDLSQLNIINVANQSQNAVRNTASAGASTILQSYAKREMSRANIKELQVQVVVPTHYNESLEPLLVDQVYGVIYEADDIDENLYVYEVEYSLDMKTGPQTKIFFCRQRALVSDVVAL